MQVDPFTAEEMLNTSAGNRKLRTWWVNLIAAAMRRGEWRVTSNGIGFNRRGQLIDAHHRLAAVVQSGVTVPALVVMGLREDAYQVIDTGVMRTVSDRLNVDPRVGEVLRMGCAIVHGTQKPTVDQMTPIIEAGLRDVAELLIETCGTRQKFVTSAAMKLAACVTIIDGGDADYVLGQYRALARLDWDAMSQAAKALHKQFLSGTAKGGKRKEVLARALRVFDVNRQDVGRIQIGEKSAEASEAFVKSVLLESVRVAERKRVKCNGVASGRVDAIRSTDTDIDKRVGMAVDEWARTHL